MIKENRSELPTFEFDVRISDGNRIFLWRFLGRIKVGVYLVGDDYYSNKIVEIKVDGENTDELVCEETVYDRSFDKNQEVLKDIWITLEHPYSPHGRSIEIRNSSESKPIIPQFIISKSN